MADIVLVHGIAQERRSAASLEALWIPPLADGLDRAGFSREAASVRRASVTHIEVDVRMAFYGDLFRSSAAEQGTAALATTAQAQALASQIGSEWLERASIRATDDDVRAQAAIETRYLSDAAMDSQGRGAIGRNVINSLARVPFFAPYGFAFAERFVKSALSQVSAYLTDDVIRDAAIRRVLEAVGPETRVVIAHSLGSVIAYEAAHDLPTDLPLLVTMGSPLGLRTIVYDKLRLQPPSFPPQVRRWLNVADRDDLVAAEPDLTALFSNGLLVTARFDGNYLVDNGAAPHDFARYLRTPEVGSAVGEALAEGENS
jgi:hypothetical protein